MKTILSAAMALSLLVTPSFAHHGLMHSGCPTGQAFTSGAITVTGAYTRAMLPGAQVAGGYLEIENAGDAPDRLVGGSSEAAPSITVHQMVMDGDMMKMGEVEGGLEIPAHGQVALAPKGYHLMMTGIETPFKEGECVQVTLNFEKAGPLAIELNIGGVGQDGVPEIDHSNMDGMEMPAPSN